MSRKVLWHTGAASQSEFDGGSRPSFDGFDDIISISSESSGSVLEISNDIENSECIVIEFLLDNLNRFTVTVINVSFAFLFLLAHIGNGSLGVDENASVSTKSSGSVRSVAQSTRSRSSSQLTGENVAAHMNTSRRSTRATSVSSRRSSHLLSEDDENFHELIDLTPEQLKNSEYIKWNVHCHWIFIR